jgi:hypothetical protein
MCPACMASAALLASGVITTGGLTALAGKMFRTAKPKKTDGLEPSTVVSPPSPAKPRMPINSSED